MLLKYFESFIKKLHKTLIVLGLVWGLLAFASTGDEETKVPSIRYAEYSHQFITQPSIPSLVWPTRPLNALTDEQRAIKELILIKAHESNLDGELLTRIAYCESKFQQKWNYMNPTGDLNSKWSAFGVFQIIKSHEAKYGISRMSVNGNLDLAIQIFQNEGLKPWSLSGHCIHTAPSQDLTSGN